MSKCEKTGCTNEARYERLFDKHIGAIVCDECKVRLSRDKIVRAALRTHNRTQRELYLWEKIVNANSDGERSDILAFVQKELEVHDATVTSFDAFEAAVIAWLQSEDK